MRLARDTARVRTLATSANLGPGFDALGLALDLYDELTVRATPGPTRVTVTGQGAGQVPTDETHLVVRVLNDTLERLGSGQIGVELQCHNRIPHGRGLGSSAAAVVGGILLAKGLIEPDADVAQGRAGYSASQDSEPVKPVKEILDAQAVLELATAWEGHPDNAAPAILGGATVSWVAGGPGQNLQVQPATSGACAPHGACAQAAPLLARAENLRVAPDLPLSVLIPSEQLSTNQARSLLPAQVPHADAAFNAGRAALLAHALGMSPVNNDLLFAATEDRLHQDYRESGMPHSLQLVRTLRSAGLPAVISGAGPTVLVFAHLQTDVCESLAQLGWEYRRCSLARRGSHLY